MNTRNVSIKFSFSALLVVLASLMFAISPNTRQARAHPISPIVLAAPDYTIPPSETDGNADCSSEGIGCDGAFDPGLGQWGDQAPNARHLFYLPAAKQAGRLLVFFNGGAGKPNPDLAIYSFAASRGYHVIGLSYFAAGDDAQINHCDADPQRLSCFEDFMREVLLGTDDCDPNKHPTCAGLNINNHPQDAAINRLLKALQWAVATYPDDGWERYLTPGGEIDWTKINLAGWSNGSAFASLTGTLFPSAGRVTVFSGPDDGKGDTEDTWVSADYIQNIPGLTDTKYYGLVHELNKAANNGTTTTLYRITRNWQRFGMGLPLNPSPFYFDPVPGEIPDFRNAHMLISTNPTTDYIAAHGSVVYGRECSMYDYANSNCDEFKGDWIGYEPAWRCVLGSGDPALNGAPHANAGADQTAECAGSGGAMVTLDGSLSSDPDCDLLTYTWTGPFGTATGRKAQVFLPVGTAVVKLIVSDGVSSSPPSTSTITVRDTTPPSLQVTLTPTVLGPADHRMVRIDAVISASDSCSNAEPTVVLTSITSDQPDNGLGDGDTAGDIQDAAFGSLDRSFLLRAERAGTNPLGRTYTVTYTAIDASGNRTSRSAAVRVPH